MNGRPMSASPQHDPRDHNQSAWDQTAEWTNYDYALLKVLENTPKKSGLSEWCRTAHWVEPPADARGFGYKVTINPHRR